MKSWAEDNLLKRVRESGRVVARDKEHLSQIIKQRIEEFGPNCDLNDIDVSQVTDMSELFWGTNWGASFNGDISNWDVSNVRDMSEMFKHSKFNRDISKWDVSNVEEMNYMFEFSNFAGDISNWNVSGVRKYNWMFKDSPLEGHEPKWWYIGGPLY